MADVLFHGGPCDGEHFEVAAGSSFTGDLVCKGTTYRVYQVEPGNFLALLPSAPPPETAAASVPAPGAPIDVLADVEAGRAPSAWRGLTHALGHDLQGGMHRAEQARRRIVRQR